MGCIVAKNSQGEVRTDLQFAVQYPTKATPALPEGLVLDEVTGVIPGVATTPLPSTDDTVVATTEVRTDLQFAVQYPTKVTPALLEGLVLDEVAGVIPGAATTLSPSTEDTVVARRTQQRTQEDFPGFTGSILSTVFIPGFTGTLGLL